MSTSQASQLPEADSTQRRSYWQNLEANGKTRTFWGRLVFVGLFLLPVVAFYTCHMLYRIMEEISVLHFEDAAMAQHLVSELRSIGFLFISVIILLCLLAVYFVFFMSVRIFGPQVALLRFIDQIKKGDYTPYRNLRKEDQLKEIWQALQELAADLHSKKR